MGYAAARYGHVMFPENVHEPALHSAEILLGGVGKGNIYSILIVCYSIVEISAKVKMDLKRHLSFKFYFSWIYLELVCLMIVTFTARNEAIIRMPARNETCL